MITWAPIKINTTWLRRLFLLGSFLDYLVSCRMSLYGLPSIKRSPRLIIVGIVHKVNCALQSSIKIHKYRSTWPEEQNLGPLPFLRLRDAAISLSCLRSQLYLRKNQSSSFSTRVPWTPLSSTGWILGFSCYPLPRAILTAKFALGKPLPLSVQECKKITKWSGPNACTNDVQHYYHFLWTCLSSCLHLPQTLSLNRTSWAFILDSSLAQPTSTGSGFNMSTS